MKKDEVYSVMQTQAALTTANFMSVMVGRCGEEAVHMCESMEGAIKSGDVDEEYARLAASAAISAMVFLIATMVETCREFITNSTPNAKPSIIRGSIAALDVIKAANEMFIEAVRESVLTVEDAQEIGSSLISTAEVSMAILSAANESSGISELSQPSMLN